MPGGGKVSVTHKEGNVLMRETLANVGVSIATNTALFTGLDLGQWISAMDQYTNYVQNFPEGTLVQKAKEQISFIKTYRL